MRKIIFYDLETTGRSAYWDQIIQIAAICTDEHLNVLDEMNLIGKLNSFKETFVQKKTGFSMNLFA